MNYISRLYILIIVLLLSACSICAGAPVCFDFETGDMQGWQVMDGKFGQLITDREFCRNTPGVKYNKQGKYYLSTTEMPGGGFDDSMTGVVESPVFLLTSPTASFLIGGGGSSETYVALCLEDGTEVNKAIGANSEIMRRVVWDTRKLIGKKVFIKIADRTTGGWGHITFDDFKAEGKIDARATENARKNAAVREKTLQEKYEKIRAQRLEGLMSEKELFERGKTKIYSGEYLDAIGFTLGGIGTGSIQIDGKAKLSIWQIFNNYKYVTVPNSFFAVRAKSANGKAVVRALQTESVGPFEAMDTLSFTGEYPIAHYYFKDAALPVKVSMETFSPMVPMNLHDSGIPCAVFNITAENNSTQPVDVSFLASQQNAVGYTGKEEIKDRSNAEYGSNLNEALPFDGGAILHFTADSSKEAPGWGDMALLALGKNVLADAEWKDINRLADMFAKQGDAKGPQRSAITPDGETVNGAVSTHFMLEPGEKQTSTFVLTWYFPNVVNGIGEWGGKGNYYQNWWPSALHVAQEMRNRVGELTEETKLFHDTVYASNLPNWMLDRITSQLAIIRSKTCFWAKDGYFGGWEGCSSGNGCCQGNCSHVWHYAQAHARLYPKLGRIMRNEEYDHQLTDGGIPYRQLNGVHPATDGQLGAILESYREYQMSVDKGWLDMQWPRIKKAMEYVINTWDKDEDGVLAGRQWNTLDDALGGNSSWMGSLYLAALKASENMANMEKEPDAAQRYAKIREAGMKKQDATVFNGEYYFQIPDPEPAKDYNSGCHIDQVLGQWWAHQLDLGWVYPPEHVQTAMKSLMKYNFHTSFQGFAQAPRKFVDDNDAAMQMITWPKGGKPEPEHQMFYADEVMSGFEYSAAAEMISAGLVKEGFSIIRAAFDRYDGRLRTGLTPSDNANWGYSGNPFGDDECGKFYARAMSIWGVLIACQGLVYDGPAGLIGFKPVWKPEDHASFFTGAECYGLFRQKRTGGEQTESIKVESGKLEVRSLVFELAKDAKPVKVSVKVAGKEVQASHSLNGSILHIELPSRMVVEEGSAVEVVVK